jgi:hypothetical protein
MINKLWLLAICLPFTSASKAQDVTWMIDQAPTISMVLVRALEKCPSFVAKVEVTVSGKTEPAPSAASGTVEYQGGNIRWEVKLADVKSPQLTQNAKAAVKQINGDRFLVLTRPDQRATYLVLSGAGACLQQPLPPLKLTRTKDSAQTETVDNRTCAKERWVTGGAGGAPNSVVTWKAKELKGVPVQTQLADSDQLIQVRFKDIRLARIPEERLRLPEGLSQYDNFEDLVQSVLVDKIKRRIGLQ